MHLLRQRMEEGLVDPDNQALYRRRRDSMSPSSATSRPIAATDGSLGQRSRGGQQ